MLAVFAEVSHECTKECLVKLQAKDAEIERHGTLSWSRRCVWYALLFHKLIKAIPPAVALDVRRLLQRCMDDEEYAVNCRVAWLPHTHHLFPDPLKVGAGLCWGCCD